jgi:DNA invertase Pin-like site-specific DNA recombinase
MKAIYTRISTKEQNNARQLSNVKDCKVFSDECSGSILFAEREQAKKLIIEIEKGNITEIQVASIDRLGRNTIDILNTIEYLNNKKVNLISEKEGFNTLINGEINPMAKLLVGIMSTLAEFEKARIKERAKDGIIKAKERGAYVKNGGRTSESIEEFLNKSTSKMIVKHLKNGFSLRQTAKLCSCSLGKVQKVSAIIQTM